MTDTPLLELLADLRRRLILFSGLSASAWGMLAAIGVILFGSWGDLVFDFPAWLRIIILLASGSAAIALVIAGIRQALQCGQLADLAKRLDSTADSHGEILSGTDLAFSRIPVSALGNRDSSSTAAAVNPLTQGLAQIAIQRATTLAGQVPDEVAIPGKPVAQSFGVLAAALAACALMAIIAPRMFSTEWSRFLDPFGDHPPYTAVEFSVEPGDINVVYGRGAEITVKVDGDEVERVDLILQPRDAKSPESLPMFPDPGGKWKASVANVTQPMSYHVRSGRARSRVYEVNVITVPKLEAVRFEITPPAYTQRPPYRGPLPTNGIAGLVGTEVRFWGKSNRQLSGGDAQLTTGQTQSIAMTPVDGDPTEVTGSFVITAPGKLQFALIDRDGQRSEEDFTASISVLKDQRPAVRLAQPREISFATPSAMLPVIISAEDDFGLAKVQIYRSLNDSRYSPGDVEVASPPPMRWQSQVMLPLSEYGLSPGDVVKVFARVEDNRPDEPQGAESEIATVRIIAEEEFDRLVRRQEGVDQLQAKYQQARRRIEQVASELAALQEQLQEKAANGEEITAEDREKLEQLAKRMEEEAEALEQLIKKNELPYDLDRELAKELEPLAEKLREMAQELRKRNGDENQSMEQLAQALSEMEEQLQQERREFDENVSEPLELLAGVLELMKDQARFTELYRQQESLAERLASLKKRDGEDNPPLQRRMRDLEAEQERVRQDLDELLDDIESHAAQLPDREELAELRQQAEEFCEACRNSGATESMKDAEMGLAEYSGAKGHAGAKEAKEKLEELLEKSDEMQAGGGEGMQQSLSFKPSLGNAAAKTLQQLLSEAGLLPGQSSGFGMGGSGGGRSARRNSLENVGLYGGQPEEQPRSSSMQAEQAHRQQGKFARSLAGDEHDPEAGMGANGQGTQAAGRAEALAPPGYRRRVAAYFERVVDELND